MSDQEFKRFLGSQASAGSLDSSGTFTLAARADAIAKLAQHSLENKNEWILKCVQAAVAGSASALAVDVGRDRIKVAFSLPRSVDLDELADHIFQPSTRRGAFVGEMAIGLRTLLAHHAFSLVDSAGSRLSWDGGGFSISAGKPVKLANGPGLQLEVSTRTLVGDHSQRARDAASISQLLARARYAPLTLSLDRRRIDPLSAPVLSGLETGQHSEASPARLLLAELDFRTTTLRVGSARKEPAQRLLSDRVKGEEPFVSYLLPDRGSAVLGWLELAVSFTDSTVQQDGTFLGMQAQRYVVNRDTHDDDFHFYRTRLGVICDSYTEADYGLAGCLVVPADHARGGLSGLALERLQTPELQRLINYLGVLRPLFDRLADELSRHRPKAFWSPPWRRKKEVAEAAGSSALLGTMLAGGMALKGASALALLGLPAAMAAVCVAGVSLDIRKDTPAVMEPIIARVRSLGRNPMPRRWRT